MCFTVYVTKFIISKFKHNIFNVTFVIHYIFIHNEIYNNTIYT
jgi:hypothetical protein